MKRSLHQASSFIPLMMPVADILQYAQPASGSVVAFQPGMTLLIVDNPALLAALTVTLPQQPIDGQRAIIASGAGITVLTINGGTIKGLITTLAANGYARYSFSASANAWFRTG